MSEQGPLTAPVRAALLELAAVDAEISRTAHRRGHLPEDAALAELTARRTAEYDAMVHVDIMVEDLDRQIAKLEADIEAVDVRRAKDQALLDAGTLPSKQLSELQHELGSVGRRKEVFEDELIEVLEQREATGLEKERASATIAVTDEQIEKVSRERVEALADLDVVVARTTADRDRLRPNLPAEVLAAYDRARENGGVGAGLVRGSRCGACLLELDRAFISKLTATPIEALVRCDECGAVMVRNA